MNILNKKKQKKDGDFMSNFSPEDEIKPDPINEQEPVNPEEPTTTIDESDPNSKPKNAEELFEIKKQKLEHSKINTLHKELEKENNNTPFPNTIEDNEEEEEDDEEDEKNEKSKKPQKTPQKKEKKIDIGKYKDPEGLTQSKMKIGLWLVVNRKNMIAVTMGILIAISIVTWSIFFYTFGSYVLIGMKEDSLMLKSAATHTLPSHNFFLSRAALDLSQGNIQTLKLPDKKYDFLIQLTNKNTKHWAHFRYHFSVNGKDLDQKTDFILPNESKYTISFGNEFQKAPTNIKFHLDEIKWNRVGNHNFPNWEEFKTNHLKFIIKDKVFIPAKTSILTEKINLNELNFSITNDSAYNYKEVELKIFLYNKKRIIGVDNYIVNNFMSGETRQLSSTWKGQLAKVTNIVITPNIDLSRNDIYIKIDGGHGEPK